MSEDDKENSMSYSPSSSSFTTSSRSSLSARRPLRSINRDFDGKYSEKNSISSDKDMSFESRPFTSTAPSVLNDTAFDDLAESEFGNNNLIYLF